MNSNAIEKIESEGVGRHALKPGWQGEGTVKVWNREGLGYGFIAVPGAKDVFVSVRDLVNAHHLEPGQVVRFRIRADPRGRLRAANVCVSGAIFGQAASDVPTAARAPQRLETIFRAGRQIVIHREIR